FVSAIAVLVLLLLAFAIAYYSGRPKDGEQGGKPAATLPATHRLDVDDVTIEFILVGKGEFWMGSPRDEAQRQQEREMQKEVIIDYDFYIGKYEVTQEQWEAVMGKDTNPSWFARKGPD